MKINKPNFFIQWHITDRCSQRCKHCYLYQLKYIKQDRQKELSLDVLSLIADDVYRTVLKLNANPVFVLTGGDPILHPEFWQILDVINELSGKHQSKVAIDILGNPFLIDKLTAARLKTKGVRKYQLSLDGLEEKHDFLRKEGSHKDTFRAAKILLNAGIKPTCMFTLSKFNALDLIGVMKEVTENNFSAFAFARFCKPSGWSVEEYKEQMFTPEEYRSLLKKIDDARKDLRMVSPRTKFVFKDHLWELYFYERYSGEERRQANQVRKEKVIIGGCGLGIASLSVLSDGAVYACRRFESPIGKVPDQGLFNLFIESKELNHFRDLTRYKKCKNCPLLYICRGCGAVSHGISGSFFNPDPQCWYCAK